MLAGSSVYLVEYITPAQQRILFFVYNTKLDPYWILHTLNSYHTHRGSTALCRDQQNMMLSILKQKPLLTEFTHKRNLTYQKSKVHNKKNSLSCN